jgi:hypothetical protein
MHIASMSEKIQYVLKQANQPMLFVAAVGTVLRAVKI